MDIKKAFRNARSMEEEKVGLNIKVPISLKNDFEEACKNNGASMTSMMLSLIKMTVEEYQESKLDPAETMARIAELEEYFENYQGPESQADEREYYKNKYDLQKLEAFMQGE